ncbi:STAS domain-containing protein [Pseudoduganella sp. OTU4001]|uniref:STAS domain-containing protein n=1 Tax=Pseudoduganella sp. OTU4001 TaxID=3043854 RepID=UPI00313E0484
MPDTTVSNQLSLQSLTVANATEALAQGLAALRAGQTVFDLGQVETVDSAAVSVMLAWQRAAVQSGSKLELRNLPEQLKSLTKLYGVCTLVSPADLHHH